MQLLRVHVSTTRSRYRFKQQPAAVLWNCVQLGRSLSKLMETEGIQRAVDSFGDAFAAEYEARMAAKLGLPGGWRGAGDSALVQQFLTLLAGGSDGHDYTNCFRALCHVDPLAGVDGAMQRLRPALGSTTQEELASWRSFFEAYLARVGPVKDVALSAARRAAMLRSNPKYILRNYHAHDAIEELEKSGDASKLHRLLDVLQRPFDEMPEAAAEGYAEPAPLEVARERGVTILS